jgi:ribulose-5-phosphate 4-epimerase/fuculose-1-phosphate aldolase
MTTTTYKTVKLTNGNHAGEKSISLCNNEVRYYYQVDTTARNHGVICWADQARETKYATPIEAEIAYYKKFNELLAQ